MPSAKLLNKRTNSKILILAVLILFLFQPLLIMPVARAEDGSDTIIDTGDANVGLGVDNDINQNNTIVGSSSDNSGEADSTGDEGSDGEQGGSEGEANDDDPEAFTGGTSCTASGVGVDNSNEAEVGNDLDGSGTTGENEIGGSEGNSQITTGDVGIGALTDNNINSNTTEVDCEDEGCPADPDAPKQIEVDNDNTASTANDVLLDGNSGENNISNTTGQAVIQTGDVGIFNIIINYLNTNFFGRGREFFVNVFSHLIGSIDLSGYGEEDNEVSDLGSSGCEAENCHVAINNSSTSTLANDININANTGINTIENSGLSIIETGDINILNDVVNVVNLNVTGNDWFFAVVNIFGFLEGDLILPGMNVDNSEAGTEELVNQVEEAAIEVEKFIVTNSNQADLMNNIDILANTGDNEISDTDGTAVISTGNALIDTKAFNLVNLNFTGDKWQLTQINLFGHWEGLIHGLPDNYSYFEDENGVTIYNDFFDNDVFTSAFAQLEVNNDNFASTTNNIEITANTGANAILHGSGDALIDTGNIFIQNSLLNFINSNFTGNAWEFSMVNVFGDWQGNLAFGRPDLWITESISPHHNPLKKGNYVTYNFLFGNNGDGLANGVKIIDDFNETFFNVAEAGDGLENNGNILFELDQLPPNSQGSISYTVQVKGGVPYGENEAPNTVTITSLEDDRDHDNNSAGGSVIVDGGWSKNRFKIAMSSGLPNLMIVKTNDAKEVVHFGDRVNYQIIIKNTGSVPLYDVLVVDVMTDESGENELNRNFWDLETVYNNEEIVIDYTLEINGHLADGTYINEAIVEGFDQETERYMSAVASSKIKVENTGYEEVVVLGEEGTPQLVVGKITRERFAYPGDKVLYKLIITNNGDLTAYGVSLTESLAIGLTFNGRQETVRQWEVGDIVPGEFVSTEYLVKVDDSLAPGIYTSATIVKAVNSEPAVSNADLEIRSREQIIEEEESTPVVSGAGSDYDGQGFYKNPAQIKTAMAAVSEPLIFQLDAGIKTAQALVISEDIPSVMVGSGLKGLLIVLGILLAFLCALGLLKRKYLL